MAINDTMQFNHWIYDKCKNDSDIRGIAYLINHNLYEKSFCIRKYYDLRQIHIMKLAMKNLDGPVLIKVLLILIGHFMV